MTLQKFCRLKYCNLKTTKFIKDSLKEVTIEKQGTLHIYIHIIMYKYIRNTRRTRTNICIHAYIDTTERNVRGEGS